jgi:leucyl-tRNA---protein transferase
VLIQSINIKTINGKQYDNYLERGWFRSGSTMYKNEFLCIQDDLSSAVNIRLDLSTFEFRKRQRKLIRNNDDALRVEVHPFDFSEKIQELYLKQRKRFFAFIHRNYYEAISIGSNYEIQFHVLHFYYKEDLIAVSFIDIGEKALASCLCLYDENYSRFSLGYYSMLKEIELAKALNLKYYYPGYVLDNSDAFDYKLRLGDMEYLKGEQQWLPYSEYNPIETLAYQFREKIKQLELRLDSIGLEYRKVLYPLFSSAQFFSSKDRLVRYPIYLILEESKSTVEEENEEFVSLIFSWDIELQKYVLVFAKQTEDYEGTFQMALSQDYLESNSYQLEIMRNLETIVLDDEL